VIGRVCEEFHVTPAAAERLLDEDGDRVLAIMELRSYKRAYDAYQQLDQLDEKAKRKLEADPLVQDVKLRDFALRAHGHAGWSDD
jgi:hypothetical protein